MGTKVDKAVNEFESGLSKLKINQNKNLQVTDIVLGMENMTISEIKEFLTRVFEIYDHRDLWESLLEEFSFETIYKNSAEKVSVKTKADRKYVQVAKMVNDLFKKSRGFAKSNEDTVKQNNIDHGLNKKSGVVKADRLIKARQIIENDPEIQKRLKEYGHSRQGVEVIENRILPQLGKMTELEKHTIINELQSLRR